LILVMTASAAVAVVDALRPRRSGPRRARSG
jgi:hypothetical protein